MIQPQIQLDRPRLPSVQEMHEVTLKNTNSLPASVVGRSKDDQEQELPTFCNQSHLVYLRKSAAEFLAY